MLRMEEGMRTILKSIACDESGQDLVEYSLLLAFICLASAALILGMGGDITKLWSVVNNRLAAANEGS
jgi:Flp pilus assembly pilin Flp